jgi:glycerophosphoryl diester phosphodiesterase
MRIWCLALAIIFAGAAVNVCGIDKPRTQEKHMEIIAHRGASSVAPENTVAAFVQAWNDEADGAECDIHMTRDGKIVVIHDPTTGRTTGIDYGVKDVNAEVLRQLDAGKWKGRNFAGQKIPFLEEVIATVPVGKQLFIEVKCGRQVLAPLARIINDPNARRLVVIGFDLAVMREAKELMPKTPVYWLVGSTKDKQTGRVLPFDDQLIVKANAARIDGLNVYYEGMTKEWAAAVGKAGLKLYAWTVDDQIQAKKLREMDVDGITTNRVMEIRKQANSGHSIRSRGVWAKGSYRHNGKRR